jgi:hypothetical protein
MLASSPQLARTREQAATIGQRVPNLGTDHALTVSTTKFQFLRSQSASARPIAAGWSSWMKCKP